MKKVKIVYVGIMVVLFLLYLICGLISSYGIKQEIIQVDCYDKYSNKIVGISCEKIPPIYLQPFYSISLISFILFSIFLVFLPILNSEPVRE